MEHRYNTFLKNTRNIHPSERSFQQRGVEGHRQLGWVLPVDMQCEVGFENICHRPHIYLIFVGIFEIIFTLTWRSSL